jgi:hypothetical protein
MGSPTSKDAQQELMERSLTNVRGLVEKLQAEEAAQRRSQKRVVVALVVVTLVLVAAAGYALYGKRSTAKPATTSVELPPPKQPAK